MPHQKSTAKVSTKKKKKKKYLPNAKGKTIRFLEDSLEQHQNHDSGVEKNSNRTQKTLIFPVSSLFESPLFI